MARRVMRQRTKRPNGAHMKQGSRSSRLVLGRQLEHTPSYLSRLLLPICGATGNPIVIFASYGDKITPLAGCRHSGKAHFDFRIGSPGLSSRMATSLMSCPPDPHGQPTVIQLATSRARLRP
jgi:hypothetical protein